MVSQGHPVNWNKDPSVLIENIVCQPQLPLLSDQKVFLWRKHHRIPKCIMMEIVHQNCFTQLHLTNSAIIIGAMYGS